MRVMHAEEVPEHAFHNAADECLHGLLENFEAFFEEHDVQARAAGEGTHTWGI